MNKITLVLTTLFLLFSSVTFGAEMSCRELDGKVKGLIAAIPLPSTYERKQAEIFTQLEMLGTRVVPFIIKYLDDRRPLRYRSIALENKAINRFEGVRFYSPEKVVDALGAILNQLTGRSFEDDYNRSTEAERDKAVGGWRNYLKEELAKGTFECRP